LFERCSTGAAREQDIDDMDGALDRAEAAITSARATQAAGRDRRRPPAVPTTFCFCYY
jgi:hypothetical protein